MTLAGILCIRNGDRLDYCWREAGQSLLGVCDELVICDCDSDDGTRQAMDEWAAREPRITLCNFPWTNPVATNKWWPEFQNYARQHAKSEWIIGLDADEILHENSYERVRDAANNREVLRCYRYNFWRDAQHLIPIGVCLGHEVVRVCGSNMPIPSDYPIPEAEETCAKAVMSKVQIMHYGFLRKREAFFRKAREVHRIWHGSFDPRLEAAEKSEGNWMTHEGVSGWENQLDDFKGTHPAVIHQWLKDRNYAP